MIKVNSQCNYQHPLFEQTGRVLLLIWFIGELRYMLYIYTDLRLYNTSYANIRYVYCIHCGIPTNKNERVCVYVGHSDYLYKITNLSVYPFIHAFTVLGNVWLKTMANIFYMQINLLKENRCFIGTLINSNNKLKTDQILPLEMLHCSVEEQATSVQV